MAEPGQVQQDEQDDGEEQQERGELSHSRVAEMEPEEQREDPERGPGELSLEEEEPVAEPHVGVHGGGAVDHHHAQHQERKHCGEQHGIVPQGRLAPGHSILRTISLNCSPRSSKLLNWS